MGLFACFGQQVAPDGQKKARKQSKQVAVSRKNDKLDSPSRRSKQSSSEQNSNFGGTPKAVETYGHVTNRMNKMGFVPGTEMANARALVKALTRKPESRRNLARLLVLEGGSEKVESWMMEEGYLTNVTSVLQALEEAKIRDRLYISTRYQQFTLNQVHQAVKAADVAAVAAAGAAMAAEGGGKLPDVIGDGAKAAAKSGQAANAFSIAESNAMGAANHARIEQTMASLAAAMAAMSAFDQAKEAAEAAAGAAARGSAAMQAAFERAVLQYSDMRQYYMLDDMAEAMAHGKRAAAAAREAVAGWAAGSMQGRQSALAAAQGCNEAAAACHKELALVLAQAAL